MLARIPSPLGFDHLKGRRVSIYAEKWLAPVLTSYASSRADVANPRSQTMNVWINDPIFIVGDHFVLRIPIVAHNIYKMKITIPIRGGEFEYLSEEYQNFLNDIVSFNDKPKLIKLIGIDSGSYRIENVNFSLLNRQVFDEEANYHILKIRSNHPDLRFSWDNEFLVLDIEFGEENYRDKLIPTIIDGIIDKVSLLVNLSYSTNVDFLEGVIYKGEEYIGKTEPIISDLHYAYEHAHNMNWPEINSIEIDKVINWFEENELNLEGNSKNKLQRAINAFSHVLVGLGEKDTSQFFWQMLGIEALLASGINSISSQIELKSSLILGEPKEYKKKIKQLYNYRSRLLHGDFDFPPKFSSDEDNFEKEYWDYLSFSTSILLALIRNLIAKGGIEYKFEYNLIE